MGRALTILRWTRRFSALAAIASLSAGLIGCDSGGSSAAATTNAGNEQPAPIVLTGLVNWAQQDDLIIERPAAQGYVDDQVCHQCHEEHAESYSEVAMSNAFGPPTPDRMFETLGNSRFYHEASDRWYDVIERDGKYYQRRWQLDEEGLTYNLHEQRIDLVMGSGFVTRTYLYRTEVGELYTMPIAWYTQTKTWGIHPGFDAKKHGGFMRPVTRDCIACHNTPPRVPEGSDLLGQPHLFPKEMPTAIGCQRCHGPGEAHVKVAEDYRASEEAIRSSILDIGSLDPQRREDVCLQCHLQPTSKHASRLQREGRGNYSFRPGEALPAFNFTADIGTEEEREARFEGNNHPLRLYRSACVEEDGRPLSCLSCHDPHVHIGPAKSPTHYRDKCLNCHAQIDCHFDPETSPPVHPSLGDPAPDDCAGCHMPKRRADDTVGALVTDHLIRARPPDEDLTAPLKEQPPKPGEPLAFWPEREHGEHTVELYLAIAASHEPDPAGAERLREVVERIKPEAMEPYAHLGEAMMRHQRFAEAAEIYESMLERYPGVPMIHTEYGRALEKLGRPGEAKHQFEQSIALGSNMPENYLGLGTAWYALGDEQRAITFLKEAIRLRHNYADAHLNMGVVLHRRNDLEGAMRSYQQTLALDPLRIEAYAYLGMTLRLAGQPAEAMRTWRRGYRADERNPALAEAYALGLLDSGKPAEALLQAEVAHRQGADEAACLFIAALAQWQLGKLEEARQIFAAGSMAAQAIPQTPSFVRPLVQPMATNAIMGTR